MFETLLDLLFRSEKSRLANDILILIKANSSKVGSLRTTPGRGRTRDRGTESLYYCKPPQKHIFRYHVDLIGSNSLKSGRGRNTPKPSASFFCGKIYALKGETLFAQSDASVLPTTI